MPQNTNKMMEDSVTGRSNVAHHSVETYKTPFKIDPKLKPMSKMPDMLAHVTEPNPKKYTSNSGGDQ